MKLVTVVGTRPSLIKSATVSRALRGAANRSIGEILVHTGQHYDYEMSGVFFRQLGLQEPRYHLNVGRDRDGSMVSTVRRRVEQVLRQERPDLVMVYGDTNSTVGGALAAARLNIPIIHVEAGLRSFNRRMPEEINRIMTDRVSKWLFCPTHAAVRNLHAEGFCASDQLHIEMVGDVMLDSAQHFRECAVPSASIARWTRECGEAGYHIATLHRAGTTEDAARLRGVFEALEQIAKHTPVIMPLHPRTRRAIAVPVHGVTVVPPVSYFDMISLLSHCKGVLTDSGGLQREACFFGKPCVTLREETEWTELVEAGASVLAGTDPGRILEAERAMHNMTGCVGLQIFGDGKAGERIVSRIAGWQRPQNDSTRPRSGCNGR